MTRMSNSPSVPTAPDAPPVPPAPAVETADVLPIRPLYLRSGGNEVFAIYQEGAGEGAAEASTAVLICSPWGWEETASYRPRLELAEALVAANHPVLRFDLPGVGDSSGAPGDPGLMSSWIAAVGDAAAWLRAESGASRLAAFGLGLGGTVAMAAIDAGAPIDELILWASPERGRHFVRESQAFGMLRAGEGPKSAEVLPPGWIEAGGFTLSAETTTELKALKPLAEPPSSLRRILFLDRDGIATAGGLRERAEGSLEVTVGSGTGWNEMVSDSELATLPAEPVREALAWLAAGDAEPAAPAPSSPTPPAPEASEATSFEVDGERIAESTFTVSHVSGIAFGVISEPAEAERRVPGLCLVYLNAGGIRHIGPNRNWVEDARRWAARGVRSIRIDLDGIGEAGGERVPRENDAEFYLDVYGRALSAVLDEVVRRGIGERFICVGLCSGGYWALRMADENPRVEAAILLNSRAVVWHAGLSNQHALRSWVWRSLANVGSWRKLLRREVDLALKARIVGRAIVWQLRRGVDRLRSRIAGDAPAPGAGGRRQEVEALLDRLRESDTRLTMGFCDNEPILADLKEDGIVEHLSRWPNVVVTDLAGDGHALSSIQAQRSGFEVADAAIAAALDRDR
jgi:alpha-beta hydrolase superfamily lysophospholipase